MLQILRRARSRPFNSLMLCKFEKSILHLHLQQSLCFYSSFANENANANENQKEEFHKFVSYLPPENNIGNINLIKHEETAVVSIENPSFMNAMTGKMMIELEEITNELSKWKTGKAVFLIGKNNQFCSGGDLKNFMNHLTTPSHGAMMSSYMHWVMRQFSLLEMTTVAIIEGQTLGGGAEVVYFFFYNLVIFSSGIYPALPCLENLGLALNEQIKVFNVQSFIVSSLTCSIKARPRFSKQGQCRGILGFNKGIFYIYQCVQLIDH